MKRLQSLPYKTLFAILFFALAGIVFFLKIGSKTQKVSAAWWDDLWHYRKAINITNSSGSDLTDFQVSVSIGTSQLIADGKMQSDCDDIRITDINGSLLPYWVEENNPGCNSPNGDTKVWLKANSLPTSGSAVYIYYGNPNADNDENGDNVFEFFDDFSDTSLNSNKWTPIIKGVGGSYSVTNGNAVLSPTSNTISSVNLLSNLTFTNNITIELRRKHASNNYYLDLSLGTGSITDESNNQTNWWHTTLSQGYWWYFQNTANSVNGIYLMNNTSKSTINTNAYSLATSNYVNQKMTLDSSGNLTQSNNGTIVLSGTNSTFISTQKNILISQGEYSAGSGDTQYIDYVFVHKYASSEPTSSLQSEEIGTAPIAYWKFDEGNGTTAYDSAGTNNGILSGSTIPEWRSEENCISGKCLYFNNTNKVQIPSHTTFNTSTMTIEMWLKLTDYGQWFGIYRGASGNNTWYFYADTSSTTRFSWFVNGTRYDISAGAPNTNEWHHFAIVISPGLQQTYRDGKLVNSSSVANGLNATDGAIKLGEYHSTGGYNLTGYLDEVKIYPYARTADQIKLDYNSRGSISGSSVNLGVNSDADYQPLSSKLIAHYKFDEGSGLTAYNSAGNHNAILSGSTTPSWQNSDQCKSGKCLYFNGINSFVNAGTSPELTPQNISIEAWVKPTNFSSNWMGILSNMTSWGTGFGLQLGTSQKIAAMVNGSYLTTTWTPSLNKWYHLVATHNNSTNQNVLYVDGVRENSSTQSIGYEANAKTYIGTFYTLPSLFFNGYIDEVKIYNYALSADEVKQAFNQGSAIQFGTTNQTIGGTTTSLDYCIPGDTSYCAPPIAEYKFDEGIGTSIIDTSGNNITANFNGTPTWTQGKIGKSLSFNGSSDYLNNTSKVISNGLGLTFGVWIKTTSNDSTTNYAGDAAQNIIGDSNGGSVSFGFGVHGGKVTYKQYAGGWQTIIGNISVNDGLWHYINVTHNQSNGNIAIYVDGKLDITGNILFNGSNRFDRIGTGYSTDYFTGQLDQLKIYNYARTPAQIAYDYNKGAPIGWWKFDECQGNTAYDWSGNANHGTINIGPGGSQNSLGTCAVGTSAAWTNGSSGKINSSLNFDGTDDFININNNNILNFGNNDFTIALWAKKNTNTFQQYGPLISKGIYSNAGEWNLYEYDSNNNWNFYCNGSNNFKFSADIGQKWGHIIIGRKTDQMFVYFNGQKINPYSDTVSGNNINFTNTKNLTISTRNNGSTYFFKGQIDDVRIYNYALTSEQVKTVYNNGAVNFQ